MKLNNFRKAVSDEKVAKRAKQLIREWKSMLDTKDDKNGSKVRKKNQQKDFLQSRLPMEIVLFSFFFWKIIFTKKNIIILKKTYIFKFQPSSSKSSANGTAKEPVKAASPVTVTPSDSRGSASDTTVAAPVQVSD